MFDGGKISIVVYPKPSLIQFSNSSSSLEERVKAEDIEPIIIKDITIRAKKKSNWFDLDLIFIHLYYDYPYFFTNK